MHWNDKGIFERQQLCNSGGGLCNPLGLWPNTKQKAGMVGKLLPHDLFGTAYTLKGG